MAEPNEKKGDEYMEKAEKALNKWSLFSGNSKYEEAAELFERAANAYKVGKSMDKAAKAFIRGADCLLKVDSKHDAANAYVNASNALRKTNAAESVACLKTAIDLLTDEGRFSMAAKYQKEIGEIYEQELDYENATKSFQAAADLYEGESSQSSANACLLKVAQYSAHLQNYEKAIEIYEKVGFSCLDNSLLKFGAKDHFFKAALCHLCTDLVMAKKSLAKYEEMDPSFSNQRECKFIHEIITAYDNSDVEAFTNAVIEFDSITKLDQWKTSLLLKIKSLIKSEGEGLS